MDQKIKYLEFIENIIERMARNSFMLKGWAITIFAGVLALTSADNMILPLLATLLTNSMFWYLDSFYLRQERLYRCLYDKVRKLSEKDIDFSLWATEKEFSSARNRIYNCIISKTELRFYGTLSLINVMFIILKSQCLV